MTSDKIKPNEINRAAIATGSGFKGNYIIFISHPDTGPIFEWRSDGAVIIQGEEVGKYPEAARLCMDKCFPGFFKE